MGRRFALDDRPGPVERADWRDVLPEFLASWEQGQHMSALGKTGSGKTQLGLHVLDRVADERGASVFALGTKARDETLRKTGWPILREWPPTYAERKGGKLIVWPPYSKPSTAKETTAPRVRQLLDEVMLEGGWRFLVDEMAYLVETLGLRHLLDEYWNGARSSGISVLGASQRPVWVARSGVTQIDWLACFTQSDDEDRNRAAEIAGDRRRFAPAIAELRRHEFLFVQTSTGRAVITKLPSDALKVHPPRTV